LPNQVSRTFTLSGTFTASRLTLSGQVLNVARTWNDANRNNVPDCDLASPFANGECGVLANVALPPESVTLAANRS
jgi:hypothetical protein